jgi:hypothetical protein
MKTRRVEFMVLVVCLCFFVLPALAAVRFDGLTWYHSEDPNGLILNEDHQLVWLRPHAPDQVTVRLSAMDVSDVNDVAEVVYLFKTEGVKTGKPSTDPTLLSGTGDIRIGFFDSNGKGHIKKDNTGYRNKTWCGYLGYCARVCPHLPVGTRRKHSDAIPGKIMKRTSRTTLVFSVTLNDVTHIYIDDDPRYQPKKIDAMAMYFPNPKAYSSITLAGCYFSCKPNTAEDRPRKERIFEAYRPK